MAGVGQNGAMARALKWILGIALALVLLLTGVAFALQSWVRSDDFRSRIEREGALRPARGRAPPSTRACSCYKPTVVLATPG